MTEAQYDVEIAGRGFLVDTAGDVPPLTHRTIPLLRRQFDTSSQAGEASLNPEGPWRRTIETWHRGAGQVDQDGSDSREGQFFESGNVDPWTKGEVRPSRTFAYVAPRASTLVSAGDHVFSVDGNVISKWSSAGALVSSYSFPGNSDGAISSMAWDGFSIFFAAVGTQVGTWRIRDDFSTSATRFVAEPGGLWYVNNRLIMTRNAAQSTLHDLSSVSYSATLETLPTAFASTRNTDLWRDLADGQGWIYAASGDGSVFKTKVKDDGSGLEVPSVAATMPSGETVVSMLGYLGFVVMGTTKGYRLAIQGSDGSLVVGASFAPSAGIKNMVAYDRFIWGTHDSGGSIIRVDLSILNDTTPAFAIESTGVGGTAGAANRGALALADDVIFANAATPGLARASVIPASDGYVTTGAIDFGLTSDKIVRGLVADVASGAVTFDVITDELTYTIGTATATSGTLASPFDIRGSAFTVKATLSSDAVLRSFTLLAFPTGIHTDQITVPLIVSQQMVQASGDHIFGQPSEDVYDQLAFLRALRDTGNFVTYKERGVSYTVQVTGVDWLARDTTDDRYTFEGTAVLTLKTLGVVGSAVVITAPNAISTVSVVDGIESASLAWALPYSGGAPISHHELRYSTDGGVSWSTPTSTGSALPSATVTSLTDGVVYLVQVRAVNSEGAADWSPSATMTPGSSDVGPANTVAPTIAGTATVGSTLTSTLGTWTGTPTPTLTRQWQSDGVDISGATGATYVISATYVGEDITLEVSADNGVGAPVTATSNTIGPVTSPVATVVADRIIDGYRVTNYVDLSLTTGTTYYVNPVGGSDSNSGLSTGAAFQTLQRAIDVSQGQGTRPLIRHAPGTYTNPPVVQMKGNGGPGNWAQITSYDDVSMVKYVYTSSANANRYNFYMPNGASYWRVNLFHLDGLAIQGATLGANQWAGWERGFVGLNYLYPSGTPQTAHHFVTANCIAEGFPIGFNAININQVAALGCVARYNAWWYGEGGSGISFDSMFEVNQTDWIRVERGRNHSIWISGNICHGNESRVPFVFDELPYDWASDGNGIIVGDNARGTRLAGGIFDENVLIDRNLCFDNGGRGVNVYATDNVDVINNTCYGNGQNFYNIGQNGIVRANPIAQIASFASNNLRMYNNIAWSTFDPGSSPFGATSHGPIVLGPDTTYSGSNNLSFGLTNRLDGVGSLGVTSVNPGLNAPSLTYSQTAFRPTTGSAAATSGSSANAPAFDLVGEAVGNAVGALATPV